MEAIFPDLVCNLIYFYRHQDKFRGSLYEIRQWYERDHSISFQTRPLENENDGIYGDYLIRWYMPFEDQLRDTYQEIRNFKKLDLLHVGKDYRTMTESEQMEHITKYIKPLCYRPRLPMSYKYSFLSIWN